MESKSIVKNMSNLKLTKEDCNICTEEVLIRKMVKCPFCLFSACIDCTSKFLMNIDDDLPRCMSLTCKKVWTYEFLAEKFDVTFHNKTYRERRADLFLQQQKALLPGTQHLVEQRNSEMKKKMLIKDLEDENYMLKTLIERNKNKIRNITYGIYDEEKKDYVVVTTASASIVVDEKKQFIRACPRNDCRGFLSSVLKCGTCDGWACKDCHEPKSEKDDPDHKCNADTVATVKLLSQDTKACPSCSTKIFKIEGCDQMFCTACKTAFSWTRGTIERGVIHNPHYYEFQRAQNNGVAPRVAGDMRCGGAPTLWQINNVIKHFNSCFDDECADIHRLMIHIEQVEITHHYPAVMEQKSLDNMRVDYLLKNINEKTWLKKLKEKSKKHEKNTAINQVLVMFTTTLADIFGNITTCKNKKDIEEHKNSMEALRLFTNKALVKIGHRFGNVVPAISHIWKFNTNSKNQPPSTAVVLNNKKESDSDDDY